MRKSRRAGRLTAALVTPALLATVLSGAGLAGPAQAATATCSNKTSGQPLSPGMFNQLGGTVVLSACNVWAVGSASNAKGIGKTLIEHWNGSKWSVVPSPNPVGARHIDLFGVSAASATSIWAVGQYDSAKSLNTKTLVLHWNGRAWTQQAAPSPGIDGSLAGVTAVSGGQVWAAGSFVANGLSQALVLHFTGGKWRVANLPIGPRFTLQATAATSARDVWAIGDVALPNGPTDSVVLHWNGKAWTLTPSPSPGFSTDLTGIAASSPSNALIVGDVQPKKGGAAVKTLALHWNGKTWTTVPSANNPNASVESELRGVAFGSKGTAMAVGQSESLVGNRSIIERWNGKRFTTVKAPAVDSGLFAIDGSSSGSLWAVGFKSSGDTQRSYALHFTS